MVWNYRVVVSPDREIPSFYIREVYYDQEGKIDGWTENHARPLGYSTKELLGDFENLQSAMTKPYLIETDETLTEMNGLVIWSLEKID